MLHPRLAAYGASARPQLAMQKSFQIPTKKQKLMSNVAMAPNLEMTCNFKYLDPKF